MTNQMPGMPEMNSTVEPVSQEAGLPENKGLEIPSHEDNSESIESAPVVEKPVQIITPESQVSNNVDIPLIPKAGIKVVAMRKGFFAQQRVKEGEEFIVRKLENLGEWMKCLDPVIEKKRVQFFKDKKAKR